MPCRSVPGGGGVLVPVGGFWSRGDGHLQFFLGGLQFFGRVSNFSGGQSPIFGGVSNFLGGLQFFRERGSPIFRGVGGGGIRSTFGRYASYCNAF